MLDLINDKWYINNAFNWVNLTICQKKWQILKKIRKFKIKVDSKESKWYINNAFGWVKSTICQKMTKFKKNQNKGLTQREVNDILVVLSTRKHKWSLKTEQKCQFHKLGKNKSELKTTMKNCWFIF